jgi:peptide deformylase
MAIRDILLLGNPLLKQPCEPVQPSELPTAIAVGQDLHNTMMSFRAKHRWGRAIAAEMIELHGIELRSLPAPP